MKKSFLAVLAMCAPFNCKAYEYFLNPIFSASERYNDNINMLADPPQANWITTISPGINFGFRNEKESFMSGFTWNHLAYTNQSELDFDEQLLNASYENRLTDRLTLGLTGSYSIRAALNTFSQTGDGGVILGDPLFSQQGLEQINVGPSITYQFDELNSINLGYSYSQSTFDASGQTAINNPFRSDFNFHQLSSSLNHILTERDTTFLTLSTSRFESKSTGQNQTSYNSIAQVGWQHIFNEQWSASVSGGLNYSVTDTTFQLLKRCAIPAIPIGNCPIFLQIPASEITDQNSGIGKIFNISIQKSFEKGLISLGASQNQTPTAQGLQTQTSIFLDSAYKISERLATGLTANYSTSEGTAGVNSNFNRSNYSVSPNVSWIWTPEINLGLSYIYRQQEFETQQQPAEGNILHFQFSYSPQLNNQVK